ncbi:MAG: hypothetical protein IKP95_05475 [Ruminococcus sp.]|nr:hypothetical protein [Ruminococcus sp.]
MDRIIKIIGNAVIDKVECASGEALGWERRFRFLGFTGYLVIRMTEDGRCYAVIDNGLRCISTSCGELTFRGGNAVFSTANSVYTFRMMSGAKAS